MTETANTLEANRLETSTLEMTPPRLPVRTQGVVAVTLSRDEGQIAQWVGRRRHENARAAGRANRHGLDSDPEAMLKADVAGAMAELAFAKGTGRYWSPSLDGADAGGDVGEIGVRSSAREDACLILHPGDDPHRYYALVTGRAPTLTVRGWLNGWEAQQDRFWREKVAGRPAFFVPQDKLHPADLLVITPWAYEVYAAELPGLKLHTERRSWGRDNRAGQRRAA